MYERSAIVLERYIENILKLQNKSNIRTNYSDYTDFIQKIEEYQKITSNETKVIEDFDNIAKEIENIQKDQEKLFQTNKKLEEERNKLFSDLGEESEILNNKFEKIEKAIDKNNEGLKELREEFIKYLSDFAIRQIERNKCEKERRLTESNHLTNIRKMTEQFNKIDVKDIISIKQFITIEKDNIKRDIFNIMIENGKNEKIGFNQEVIKIAISSRIEIAEKEAECYVIIYDKMRRLLSEIENDNLKLDKYKKTLKNISAKLNFIQAQKEYIVGFLDNERMTAISGLKIHNKMMKEACQNFQEDMVQINNLYELVLREIANKATKKAYNELYNNTYLRDIEVKERNFEKEVNNIKTNIVTVINSNYWRIEGIKNIYNVFKEEITNKFEKDLSEYEILEENFEDEDFGELEDEKAYETDEKASLNKINYEENYDEYEEEYDDFEDEDEEDSKYENDFEEDYYDDEYEEKEEYSNMENNEESEDDEDEYEIEDDYEEDEIDNYYDESNEENDEEEYEIDIKNTSKKPKTKNIIETRQKQTNGIFNKFFKEMNVKNKNKRNN